MTTSEYNKLTLNQRVKFSQFNKDFEWITKYGYVTKIYNGNYQLQVWFDGEPKPRTLGYLSLELI